MREANNQNYIKGRKIDSPKLVVAKEIQEFERNEDLKQRRNKELNDEIVLKFSATNWKNQISKSKEQALP